MLKIRIIPILTFNGFALVKTKQFSNPRMVGNPVQAARVFNSRGVDELIFLDIFASKQNRKINLKVVKDVIKECFMPVGIGGGINSIEDINDLLKIGADKVVIKKQALIEPAFIKTASDFFGSQCISIAIDVIYKNNDFYIYNDLGVDYKMGEYIKLIQELGAGEIILNNVDNDGLMNGFNLSLFNQALKISKIPIVYTGGGGQLKHYEELFKSTSCNAVGSSSIFHFTQFTPLDIKNSLKLLGKPVRV
jgi:cyclase